ncbi:MAG: ATP synthase F1 subunit epsilon [Fimbriimonadaceae bacterium]
MASEFTLSVVAPDREVLDQPVTSAVAPGVLGYFGVYAGHEPIVAALRPGLLEYTDSTGARHFVSIAGGFAEVTSTRMTVLADAAERAQDVDAKRAEEALDRARRVLRGESSDMTQSEAVDAVERAAARLRASKAAAGAAP